MEKHNQIDHVPVNQQFRRSVPDTRAMRGTDVGSDHQLVKTKVKLNIKKITQLTSTRIRYHANKLQNESVRKTFSLELCNWFAVLEAIDADEEHDINTKRTRFNKAYNDTAEKIRLGKKRTRSKLWISQGF